MLKSDIEVTGIAMVSAPVRTLGDLRMLVSVLDEHTVPDDAEVDWGTGKVHVDLSNLVGEFIECGEHIPPESKFDVLLLMHSHDEQPKREKSLREWLGMDNWRGPDYAK